jgi:hypothetical protein
MHTGIGPDCRRGLEQTTVLRLPERACLGCRSYRWDG